MLEVIQEKTLDFQKLLSLYNPDRSFVKRVARAFDSTYILTIIKSLKEQPKPSQCIFLHINQSYDILWKKIIEFSCNYYLCLFEVINQQKFIMVYLKEMNNISINNQNGPATYIVEVYDLKNNYSSVCRQIKADQRHQNFNYFLTKNRQQICLLQETINPISLNCFKMNLSTLQIICQHKINFDQSVERLSYTNLPYGVLICPSFQGNGQPNINNDDDLEGIQCYLALETLTCQSTQFQRLKKQYNFRIKTNRYPQLKFLSFCYKDQRQILFSFLNHDWGESYFYQINLLKDRGTLDYLGTHKFNIQFLNHDSTIYDFYFYCMGNKYITTVVFYSSYDNIQSTSYVEELEKDQKDNHYKSRTSTSTQFEPFQHFFYEMKKSQEYFLDYIKTQQHLCVVKRWRYIDFKTICLHLLLNVNQDFDDDLLSDCIRLLK